MKFMRVPNRLFKVFNIRKCILLFLLSGILYSCSVSEKWFFKEGGCLLWVNELHKDSAIKNAIKGILDNSSVIIAQVPWKPKDSSFFYNTAWYYSLAKEHGKNFMIAIDWQKLDRSGTNDNWSFSNEETARLFKFDMLRLVNEYNPDYLNLGVEVNYYALTSSKGFKAFASVYRELKNEIKKIKPEIKVGLSYQLELLYGHHRGWNESKTMGTLDNLLGDLDFLGISTYPNMITKQKTSNIFFSTQFIDSLTSKYSLPIGISETAISSDLYNEDQRKTYVNTIFQKANDLNLKFVIWGSMIDDMGHNDWSDKTGLLTKDGQAKIEFNVWKKENLNFYK